MSNEATKDQIRRFLQKAVEDAQNPDSREQQKKKRLEKSKKISKKYGF